MEQVKLLTELRTTELPLATGGIRKSDVTAICITFYNYFPGRRSQAVCCLHDPLILMSTRH